MMKKTSKKSIFYLNERNYYFKISHILLYDKKNKCQVRHELKVKACDPSNDNELKLYKNRFVTLGAVVRTYGTFEKTESIDIPKLIKKILKKFKPDIEFLHFSVGKKMMETKELKLF